ncbi:MAG: Rab family GTPase [Candidatus Heimdallarchaeota archaeon]
MILLKICLLGDGAVGKTSIVRRFATERFSPQYLPTLGIDITSKNVVTAKYPKISARILFVDLAGQEYFGRVRSNYFKGANGYILVYDVTREHTCDNIAKWIKEGWDISGIIPLVIAGNKIDLREKYPEDSIENKKVMQRVERIATLARKEKGFDIKHFDISARTGEGINEAMDSIVTSVLEYDARIKLLIES